MTGTRWSGRLKAELRDFLEVVALPALAMVLPWSLCYRVLRRLARWSWLYRAETDRAFAQAKALGWVHGDESTWRQLKRLTSLVDHADHYLTRTRSDTWMQKHLTHRACCLPFTGVLACGRNAMQAQRASRPA